jgi:hypothetical protein
MANLKKSETLVLELIDRVPSSFIMEGTENNPEPDALDAPSQMLLLNYSHVMVDGKREAIRYIYNQDEIFVSKQEEKGLKPNPRMDIINFELGKLSVVNEGISKGLYNFLKNCEWNIDNPNAPSGATPIFKEIKLELEAEAELESLDDYAEALQLVSALHTKGAKGYTYDSKKIGFYIKLFNLVNMDNDAEKMRTLVSIATERPSYFVSVVNGADVDNTVLVNTARELGVIIFGDSKVILADENEVIYKLKSKVGSNSIREFVNFLATEEGLMILARIETKLEYKKTQESGLA